MSGPGTDGPPIQPLRSVIRDVDGGYMVSLNRPVKGDFRRKRVRGDKDLAFAEARLLRLELGGEIVDETKGRGR